MYIICIKLGLGKIFIYILLLQDRYSKKNATDNLTVLQGQVKEVTGVMSQNIESVIQRGERLDDLMDKTDELEAAVCSYMYYTHYLI
jgi:vesicle-associated membrane protein 7